MYIQHSTMLVNRVQYFIRSILQSSKLNREKFVINKKKYNMMIVKNRNHHMIIRRNFGSSSNSQEPTFGGGPNKPMMFLLAIAVISQFHKRRQ